MCVCAENLSHSKVDIKASSFYFLEVTITNI